MFGGEGKRHRHLAVAVLEQEADNLKICNTGTAALDKDSNKQTREITLIILIWSSNTPPALWGRENDI